ALDDLDYPTSDGRPMAETDWHRKLMNALIDTLAAFFLASPRVYVSGNLLVFYEPGNRRRHVAPDVFLVPALANTPPAHHRHARPALADAGRGTPAGRRKSRTRRGRNRTASRGD